MLVRFHKTWEHSITWEICCNFGVWGQSKALTPSPRQHFLWAQVAKPNILDTGFAKAAFLFSLLALVATERCVTWGLCLEVNKWWLCLKSLRKEKVNVCVSADGWHVGRAQSVSVSSGPLGVSSLSCKSSDRLWFGKDSLKALRYLGN